MGRHRRCGGGPGPPATKSKPCNLASFLDDPENPDTNTYSGIPEFPKVTAYGANTDGTFPPDVLKIMEQRMSPEVTEELRRRVMNEKIHNPNRPMSSIQRFLHLMKLNDDVEMPRFVEKNSEDVKEIFDVEAVEDKDKEVFAKTKCPVCYNVCMGEIFRCENHHVLCMRCKLGLAETVRLKTSLAMCPCCRADGIPNIRATSLEEWVKTVDVHCGFHHLGCEKTGKIEEIMDHKMSDCEYRSWICYFCDLRVTIKTFGTHLTEVHEDKFLRTYKYESARKSKPIKLELPLRGDEYGMTFIRIILADAGCFILTQIKIEKMYYIYFTFKIDTEDQANEHFTNTKIMYMDPVDACLPLCKSWTMNVLGGQRNMSKILKYLDKIQNPREEYYPKFNMVDLYRPEELEEDEYGEIRVIGSEGEDNTRASDCKCMCHLGRPVHFCEDSRSCRYHAWMTVMFHSRSDYNEDGEFINEEEEEEDWDDEEDWQLWKLWMSG